jgi:hypothetical protein
MPILLKDAAGKTRRLDRRVRSNLSYVAPIPTAIAMNPPSVSVSRFGRLWRVLAVLGSVVVLATAAFHLTGYADARGAGQRAGGWYPRVFPALWVGFSLTLAIGALGGLWASLRPATGSRALLGLSAVLLWANAALLFAYLGNFAGAWLLALGALAISAAWLLAPYAT